MSDITSPELREILRVLARIDPDHSMFDGFEDKVLAAVPSFETQDVATIFFQKSTHWFRWRDQQGVFNNPDGTRVEPGRNEKKVKKYSLIDIEKLLHNGCANGTINFSRMLISLQIVRLVALGYEVFPVD